MEQSMGQNNSNSNSNSNYLSPTVYLVISSLMHGSTPITSDGSVKTFVVPDNVHLSFIDMSVKPTDGGACLSTSPPEATPNITPEDEIGDIDSNCEYIAEKDMFNIQVLGNIHNLAQIFGRYGFEKEHVEQLASSLKQYSDRIVHPFSLKKTKESGYKMMGLEPGEREETGIAGEYATNAVVNYNNRINGDADKTISRHIDWQRGSHNVGTILTPSSDRTFIDYKYLCTIKDYNKYEVSCKIIEMHDWNNIQPSIENEKYCSIFLSEIIDHIVGKYPGIQIKLIFVSFSCSSYMRDGSYMSFGSRDARATSRNNPFSLKKGGKRKTIKRRKFIKRRKSNRRRKTIKK